MLSGVVGVVKKVVSKKRRKVTAVIVAGGKSERMRGIDKIFAVIGNQPLIAETISVFQNSPEIDEIILVLGTDSLERGRELVEMHGFTKVKAVIEGGADRAHSSYNGVSAVDSRADYIIIHDGARPLVTENIISSVVAGAVKCCAATAAIPVTSTVKRCSGGFICETVERDGLYEIQTPQAFRADILKAALKNAVDKGLSITDDCMAVEAIGLKPAIVSGSRDNIKVTVREDIPVARAILESRETENENRTRI